MTQRTLAIIKPDAVANGAAGRIIARIEAGGFKILAAKLIHMSLDDAAGFYAVHRERPFFKSLCTFMTQGPCQGRRRYHPEGVRLVDRGERGARLGWSGDGRDGDRLLLQRARDPLALISS
jgi:hypothetical protein